MYSINVPTEKLIEGNMYSYKGNEVLYEEFNKNNNSYVFVGFNDKYYYAKTLDENIKLIIYNCSNISFDEIPINTIVIDLINKYKDIDISHELNQFQNNIVASMFVSLYIKENGVLVIKKDRYALNQNRQLFNYYCLSLPKSVHNFVTYRAEYRLYTDDMVDLVYNLNEINFDYPFSTTYNLDFALDWLGANILFVINVPSDCNYMLLKNNSSQFEITLQQGKLLILNKYKLAHKNKNHIVFICDFIPSFC